MEQNPHNRTPPPSLYPTVATQHPPPPPPQHTAHLPSGMLPENYTAAPPQGFLPFYHPNQFFRGFHANANAAAGFGQVPPQLPPCSVPAATAGRSGLQHNQGEPEPLLVKPSTENKEATALESRKAALMGELEAMRGNAPQPAATAPPPSESNAGGDSDIDDDDVAEITAYMEEAVKKLMAHQQTLHDNFIKKLEKMEAKRRAMDEEWRKMEMERIELMASFKEKDKAIAMEREEIVFAYLEKVTAGQTIRKPASSWPDQRWSDQEVSKLVEMRIGLEPRFNQPGCKIAAWVEISRQMAEAGYRRSAMRCKEKWENMNNYFKKLKKNSSPKKRAKTCQYYEKLDRLYSKSSSGCSTSDANDNGGGTGDDQTTALKK